MRCKIYLRTRRNYSFWLFFSALAKIIKFLAHEAILRLRGEQIEEVIDSSQVFIQTEYLSIIEMTRVGIQVSSK